ncbi:MAG: carbohydrate-binding protein [Rhodoferax sp.]|nr:carbohydrate-binding protein [Rhodoferax sp.]
MKKRLIHSTAQTMTHASNWLDLDKVAEVEISSEDVRYPIENALSLDGDPSGWVAAEPGAQTLRLVFCDPRHIKRIRLVFVETYIARTQEYVLRWSGDGGHSYRDILRQQWNFNPDGNTREEEDYRVDLPGVTTLELHIIPEISGGNAMARLARWQVE